MSLAWIDTPLKRRSSENRPFFRRKRRTHSSSTVLRNYSKMEATACPDWKRGSPSSSLWVQLNRILGIANNIGVQYVDVLFPYCVALRDEFQFKDIGNLPSLYDGEIRCPLRSVSHFPCWFDDNMDTTRQIRLSCAVQDRLEPSLRYHEATVVGPLDLGPTILVSDHSCWITHKKSPSPHSIAETPRRADLDAGSKLDTVGGIGRPKSKTPRCESARACSS